MHPIGGYFARRDRSRDRRIDLPQAVHALVSDLATLGSAETRSRARAPHLAADRPRSVREVARPTSAISARWKATSPHDGAAGFDVVVLGPVPGADCPGHMGATPQPKAAVASDNNQRRRSRNSGISNGSGSNQPSGESIAVFEARIVRQMPPDGRAFYIGLAIGDGDLGLVDDDPHAPPDSPQRVMLDVEVESVDALRSAVESAGGQVLGPPNDIPWGMRVMHTADPDGNAVNISQHIADSGEATPE